MASWETNNFNGENRKSEEQSDYTVQARLHLQIGVGIFYISATCYKDVAGGEETSTAEGVGRST